MTQAPTAIQRATRSTATHNHSTGGWSTPMKDRIQSYDFVKLARISKRKERVIDFTAELTTTDRPASNIHGGTQ